MNTCSTCVYWRKKGVDDHCPPLSGICTRYLDSCCNKVAMNFDDYCSHHVPIKVCVKEPTDAASVLMSLLIKQVTELQSKVQDLSLKMDIMNARLDNHVDDRDRHLRQPGKYTAHNLFM